MIRAISMLSKWPVFDEGMSVNPHEPVEPHQQKARTRSRQFSRLTLSQRVPTLTCKSAKFLGNSHAIHFEVTSRIQIIIIVVQILIDAAAAAAVDWILILPIIYEWHQFNSLWHHWAHIIAQVPQMFSAYEVVALSAQFCEKKDFLINWHGKNVHKTNVCSTPSRRQSSSSPTTTALYAYKMNYDFACAPWSCDHSPVILAQASQCRFEWNSKQAMQLLINYVLLENHQNYSIPSYRLNSLSPRQEALPLNGSAHTLPFKISYMRINDKRGLRQA